MIVKKATFAGGCFWCMEPPFEKISGVIRVRVGYTGGYVNNPSYEDVSSGKTGHFEAVEITYDPSAVDYSTLLEVFWRNIDPTDCDGQFADRGQQYRTAIFYHDEKQRRKAEKSKKQLQETRKFSGEIATKILPAQEFYPAEEYHQKYATKNPQQYHMYLMLSGRKRFLKEKWK
ncbi:MAG: peptide-methionine (S)-S-oxide reductase MsrA [Spirochaetes bacterium]|nr:peptide-methionine (S)-S-oxide reductase MsrA [Spirochaetota bacterium]